MSAGGARERTCCGSLFTFLITAGFVILIYWAIFQPHQIRATVESATLSNLTVSNATVSYRLAVSLNLYNPSLRVNVYYDTLDADLHFKGTFLSRANGTSPAEFYQRAKKSDNVTVDFDGSGVGVPGEVAVELEKEKEKVSLEVSIDARVRYRFGSIKIRQKPRIWCSLTIPVKPEGRGGAVGGALASGDRCSVKY